MQIDRSIEECGFGHLCLCSALAVCAVVGTLAVLF